MSVYLEPSYLSRMEANQKTMILKQPIIAERREYLKTHTIAETLALPKKKEK